MFSNKIIFSKIMERRSLGDGERGQVRIKEGNAGKPATLSRMSTNGAAARLLPVTSTCALTPGHMELGKQQALTHRGLELPVVRNIKPYSDPDFNGGFLRGLIEPSLVLAATCSP